MRPASVALLLLLSAAASAQPIHPDLEGPDLIDALVADYKPTTVLSLAASKDALYAVVDSAHVDGRVGTVGLYSGLFVPFDCQPSCDPSQDVFNGGTGISQEHLWPRSHGAACGADAPPTCDDRAERDLHHLRPARQAVNAARGNLPFGESDDALTTAWYRLETSTSAPPDTGRDAWSERQGSRLFEPRASEKGDVARAAFYVFTMYGPRSTGQADAAFFASMREALLAWHHADPPDDRNIARSQRAASFQDDLANPFVVDPTLAARAFGAFPTRPPSGSPGRYDFGSVRSRNTAPARWSDQTRGTGATLWEQLRSQPPRLPPLPTRRTHPTPTCRAQTAPPLSTEHPPQR